MIAPVQYQAASPEKSAQPTIENSPPIYRWDQNDRQSQSVKRTAELKFK